MTIDQGTNLKKQLLRSLQSCPDAAEMDKIVRNYRDSGGTRTGAYDTLQEIWQECGFDEDEHSESNPKRDVLEHVMQRVWNWSD